MSIGRLSVVNHVAATATVITPSSEDSNFPATNLKAPQRPGMPWRTGATGAQSVVVDFGAAVEIGLVLLPRLNVAAIQARIHSADSWAGAVDYDSGALVVNRSPLNGRYVHALVVSPAQTKRYLRLDIPSQTPVDGAAYYLVGGVWAGPALAIPRDSEWDFELGRIVPAHDETSEDNTFRERSIMGAARFTLRASLQAPIAKASPAYQDTLAAWMEMDRLTSETDFFAFFRNQGDSSQAGIVRRMDAYRWTVGYPVARGAFELEEVA